MSFRWHKCGGISGPEIIRSGMEFMRLELRQMNPAGGHGRRLGSRISKDTTNWNDSNVYAFRAATGQLIWSATGACEYYGTRLESRVPRKATGPRRCC
jgi:hypothetical protein